MDLAWDEAPRPRPAPLLATPVKRVNRLERPAPPKAERSQPSRLSPPKLRRSNTKHPALLKKLQKLLPLDPGEPEHGSWLSLDPMGKPRCLACEDFIASSAKLGNLQRHGTCTKHVKNAAVLLGASLGSDAHPSAEEFKAVLGQRRKHLALSAPSDVAGAKKQAQMTWCLGEAYADETRRFFKSVSTMAILQDVRKDMLCIRFAAAGSRTFEIRRGLLGCLSGFGTGAKALKDATLTILRDACTSRANRPAGSLQPPQSPVVDEALLAHLIKSVEMFVADGANDEQKTGKLFSGQAGGEPVFPGIKMVVRDRTHAATRLTQKTWTADPFLHDVFQTCIHGQHSITALIFHSPAFQNHFNYEVRRLLDCDEAFFQAL